jgi:hypothetical protein
MNAIRGTSTNLEDKLLEAIKENCVECSGGSWKQAARCAIPECPLYGFRELAGLVENVLQNANEKGVRREDLPADRIPDGVHGRHESLAAQSLLGTM